MADFRVEGITLSGKPVGGVITAETKGIAKKKASDLARDKKFKITGVFERANWIYRVQKGTEKPLDGEQKAYTKDEVRIALEKMGYKVLYVRKKLFGNKQKAAPAVDIIAFVRISADLMRQKLPYNEVLQLLVNDASNPALRDALKEINAELKQGKDSEKVFVKQAAVFGKFTANMLGLASKSGNMAEIYDSTAKFLERNAEFKRNLKSALIMPIVTLFVLGIAIMFYVAYIFPKTAEAFIKMGVDMAAYPMTNAALHFSAWFLDNVIIIIIVLAAPVIAAMQFFRTERGQFMMDQYIIKVPVVGTLLHKTAIEIFCRVFYALYSGSGENIDIIRMSSEACGNKYMESQIKKIAIPLMLEKGKGLTDAFEATGVFTKTAISRFSSGAETGTVRNTAQQLAEYYEKETTYKLRNAIEVIQLAVQMIIMLALTGLTLVSSETAAVSPKRPGQFIIPVLHWLLGS